MVEQNALGHLADDRFAMLSREYEAEQAELLHKIREIQQKVSRQKADSENAVKFYEIIHNYSDIEELTVAILHELIDHITVYNAIGRGKRRTQYIEIHYRFVGHLSDDFTSQ